MYPSIRSLVGSVAGNHELSSLGIDAFFTLIYCHVSTG